MSILSRYIFKEFFPPLLIGVAFFTLIFVLPQIKELAELKVKNDIPLFVIFEIFFYTIPVTASVTIPMGVLFGSIFALSRLSSDSEMVAMRANGISFRIIVLPTILFGLLMTIFTFLFVNFVTPKSNYRYKSIFINILYSNPSIILEKKQFMNIPNTDMYIAAAETSGDGQKMEKVYIYEKNKETKEEIFIHAQTGKWINNELNSSLISLDLNNGEMIRMLKGKLNEVEKTHFSQLRFNIASNVKQVDETKKTALDKNLFQLANEIKENKSSGASVDKNLIIEYHKKISIPLACLVFVMVAMPLSIFSKRSGKGVSFGFTIVIIFFYYLMMVIGEAMGKKGSMPPNISMYVPVVITMLFSLYLMWRKVLSNFQ